VKDLTAKVPTGKGTQTYLRAILLVIDHTAYHVGQFVAVRRALGVWKQAASRGSQGERKPARARRQQHQARRLRRARRLLITNIYWRRRSIQAPVTPHR